jgi:hypothetical protein
MYVLGDEDVLIPYKCLICKHVEFFEAYSLDVNNNVSLRQVGLRCQHYDHIHPEDTTTGGMEFPQLQHDDIGAATQRLVHPHLTQT